MRRLYIATLIILWAVISQAQINSYGIPYITNYVPNVYPNNRQVWSVAQDNRGVLYFATSEGIIEFDGNQWRGISACDDVSSLAADENGTIYVGGYNDFGYLTPDTLGQLKYRSLRHLIPENIELPTIDDNITFSGDTVFFVCQGCLVVYNRRYNMADMWPVSDYSRVVINGGLKLTKTTGDIEHIATVDGKGERPLIRHDILFGVADIEKIKNNEVLLSLSDHFALYDPYKRTIKNHKFNDVSGYVDMVKSGFDKIEPLGNRRYAFSLREQNENVSVAFFDSRYNVSEIINSHNGGLRQSITYLLKTTDSLLWCSHWGVTSIEYGSPFRCFTEGVDYEGIIVDIKELNGEIYIATTLGLYYLAPNEHHVNVMRKLTTKPLCIYSLCYYTNPNTNQRGLLAASDIGIYQIINHKVTTVALDYAACDRIFQPRNDLKSVLATSYSFTRFRVNKSSILKEIDTPESFELINSYIVDSIQQDKYGDIWFVGLGQGLFRIFDRDDIELFEEDEIPNVDFIANLREGVVFATQQGIFKFNRQTHTFSKANADVVMQFTDSVPLKIISQYGDGYVMCDQNGLISVVVPDKAGRFRCYNKLFRRWNLNNSAMPLFVASDSTLWIANDKNLVSYRCDLDTYDNLTTDQKYAERPYNTLIRKVQVNDSAIFMGAHSDDDGLVLKTQPTDQIPVIEYKHNNISFSYSAVFFECADRIEYSYKLENYNDNWSEWSDENEINYTNLFEGEYTFCVKARNIYQTESTVARYTFVVLPPWYRTWWAYALYVLMSIALLVESSRLYSRNLRIRNEKLEHIVAERTNELQKQKEDLAASKVKIEKQYAILKEQKLEIERRDAEIVSGVEYAGQIQAAMLTPNYKIQSVFPNHFILYLPCEIVSGDFYWVGEFGSRKICVVADCTGHGVPSGFLSMLGISFISHIVSQVEKPNEILNNLQNDIVQSLHQKEKAYNIDGMDVCIYSIDTKTNTLEYAGASMPLFVVRNGELIILSPNKKSIGAYQHEDSLFTCQSMQMEPGDMIYAFSDGYIDQFGGPKNRKFMMKNFKELLVEIADKPLAQQQRILQQIHLQHRGSHMQTDDILVFGVRV